MLQFEHIEYLYALGLIPVFILFFWIHIRRQKKSFDKIGDKSIIKPLLIDVSKRIPLLKFILLMLAYICLIIGIANPLVGSKTEEVKRTGVDLMICLDVSNSMLAEDIQPNRLIRSKQALSKLIDNLNGDRIGIIIFAGKAFVQLPLTSDYGAAKMFLETINTDLVKTQGTAIGEAINLAVNSFDQEDKKSIRSKAIILISDGENHEDDVDEAVNNAKKQGILVHTLGMGLSKGVPIPIYSNGQQVGFKKDKQGNVILTRMNSEMLQKIAQNGKGVYIQANNVSVGLKEIFDSIEKMNKNEYDTQIISDYDSQYFYFILLAFILLVLELVLSTKQYNFLNKVRLFGEQKN